MASRPAKKRKLTPPQSDDEGPSRKSSAKIQKAFIKNAANWDLEQAYETKARKGKKKEKESTRLPLKLPGGRVQKFSAPVNEVQSEESDGDWLEGSGDESADDAASDGPAPEKPGVPEHQQILEAKEELAKIASILNEGLEENVGAFKAMAKIGQSKIPTIQKLTLATQLAVYKDLIPGYRIRPISEDSSLQGEKLSKEVRKSRTYEQSLIAGYQAYVKDLTRYAKAGRKHAEGSQGRGIASVAITCACTLLTAVPHFNFRGDLIKILVGKLSTRHVDEDFNKCLQALETLFIEDEEGRPAMEAVSLLSKMMRAREYQVNEGVVNLFLHLRLLSEFAGKASKDSVERAGPEGRKPKAKKEFRTKRERKQLKEQKALQKDMANADALVSHEERDRTQSETLKLVFATYFRILKLRAPHLMGAVLEGLAKYAHLINQDFFGDLLEALKDLIRHSDAVGDEDEDEDGDEGVEGDDDAPVRNPSREALLCTVTAFALLAGQDAHNARADLHLDLSFFTTHLFQTLFPLSLNADLELGAKSLHLPDPNLPASSSSTPHPTTAARNKVNLQTTTVLLIRCLTSVLLAPWNTRSVPPLRLAAFTKQLATASLHMPERSAQAVLALLADVGGTHGRRVAALWNTEERKGDGAFHPLSESVEGSNPYAATVWEGEILRRHYCPKVREGVRIVERSLVER
ncbi:nucleolar complex-associated protein 3 [Whalleya microplaca]|nr:nucleolar complex-associated protein 3 [Whalleya microplaca]